MDVSAAKTMQRLLSGASDAAIRFDDLCVLLEDLGFEKRVRGGSRDTDWGMAGEQVRSDYLLER